MKATTLPKLTEAIIRAAAAPESFQRGREYSEAGAVSNTSSKRICSWTRPASAMPSAPAFTSWAAPAGPATRTKTKRRRLPGVRAVRGAGVHLRPKVLHGHAAVGWVARRVGLLSVQSIALNGLNRA